MKNCGIDIIEISRIAEAVSKNAGFLERIFTVDELEYYFQSGHRIETLAGFFAAKEAFSKYLGTGISGFNFNDVSVGHTKEGAPVIYFKGRLSDAAVSISHNKTTAVAVVCGDAAAVADCGVRAEMKLLVPKRCVESNKGDFGRVLVIAGSRGMTGAAALSAYSALRSGAGLVTLATAESERSIAAGFYPELMTCGLEAKNGIISADAMGKILSLACKKDAVIFGPGLGQSQDIALILEELLKSYEGKLVIDADGINALSKNTKCLYNRRCSVVLTPHPGEMSRLTRQSIAQIQQSRIKCAESFAAEYGVTLVLKGSGTVVAAPGCDTYVNVTGNSGLATAGTGDVLAGVTGGFCAQGMDTFDAARLGVYVHGLAGDLAKQQLGEHGMLASDVAQMLPKAILETAK